MSAENKNSIDLNSSENKNMIDLNSSPRLSLSSHESLNTYSTVQGGPITIDSAYDSDEELLNAAEKIDDLYSGLSDIIEQLTKENVLLIDTTKRLNSKILDLEYEIERLKDAKKEIEKQILVYRSQLLQILNREIESTRKFRVDLDHLIRAIVKDEISKSTK